MKRLLVLAVLCFLFSVLPVAANNLTLDTVDVSIDYTEEYDRISDTKDRDESVDEGEEIQADVYPGSTVDFELTIRNDFPSNSDLKIESIVAEITIEDIDDGSDLDRESSKFDLEQGEDKEVTLLFTVPTRVVAKEYDVEIKVEGEDENSTTYTLIRNIKLKIIKEPHDLEFTNTRLDPETVTCGDTIRIRTTVFNQGTREQDEAAVEIRNNDLGLDFSRDDIELIVDDDDAFDEDNQVSFDIPFTVPADTTPGDYEILFKAFYSNTIAIEETRETLKVVCQTPEPEEPSVDCSGEEWNCDDFSECQEIAGNFIQTRSCTIKNECRTEVPKPDTTQSCTPSQTTEQPEQPASETETENTQNTSSLPILEPSVSIEREDNSLLIGLFAAVNIMLLLLLVIGGLHLLTSKKKVK